MSLTIDKKKLKFSVFGNGFEDDRADSGMGAVEDKDLYSIAVSTCAIDNTGTYAWFCNYNQILKYQLSDMTSVAHSITGSNAPYHLSHPTNVANNYGVLFSFNGTDTDITVFDLTDETVYLSVSGGPNGISNTIKSESILVGDHIYFIDTPIAARTNCNFFDIDLDAGTVSYTQISGNVASGFVDNDTIYRWYLPEWFYQKKVVYGNSLSFSQQWSVTASASGSSGFPYVAIEQAMCGNGCLYVPTYKNSAWRIGVYNGNSAPNFETPKPLRTFGKFTSAPNVSWWCFNDDRSMVTFATSSGVYVSDFHDIELITTDSVRPLAMNDDIIIASYGGADPYKIGIFKYR